MARRRRRHLFNTIFDTRKELFPGTSDSRGVGDVGVLVNTILAMNMDSFEQLTTRTEGLPLKRCGPLPALTIFGFHAPPSNYGEDEVEAFYMDLYRFYTEDDKFSRLPLDI
ncbi:unnamed protein product [Angiostrongylus costaricensis]|uniref:COesterase domain-containing protein n=1 Tax=Angiostrongylus costaricensis TaxID=334426 RepID=A0A0R3P9H9_ANGCS|nr:unnamed protein product [Angiostrongylus costaricensis]